MRMKHYVTLLLIAAMLCAAVCPAYAADADTLPVGDSDLDGAVRILDATTIQRAPAENGSQITDITYDLADAFR